LQKRLVGGLLVAYNRAQETEADLLSARNISNGIGLNRPSDACRRTFLIGRGVNSGDCERGIKAKKSHAILVA